MNVKMKCIDSEIVNLPLHFSRTPEDVDSGPYPWFHADTNPHMWTRTTRFHGDLSILQHKQS